MNRYIFLDAIRGIAALFILARHTPGFWGIQLPYSYLAVDIFFVLSGFVIAHAYDGMLQSRSVTIRQFLVIRLIRLYPIFILSVALCLTVAVLKLLRTPHADTWHLLQLLQSALLTAFFLPSTLPLDDSLFPLNGVYWSLFFELALNIFYALLRQSLTTLRLAAVIMTSAVALSVISYRNDGLNVGYIWDVEHIIGGFARATFGIALGLLIHRCRDRIKIPQSPWLGVAIITVMLGQPALWSQSWIFDLLAVFVLFPLACWTAATSSRSAAERLLLALGSASYPIYVLHFPIAQLTASAFKGASNNQPFFGIAFAISMIALGMFIEKTYDAPVRRKLSNLLLPYRRARVPA